MAERVKNQIGQEDKERLVLAYKAPEQDYLAIADNLGINRSTARGIVAQYLRENRVDERPRGGRNHVKADDEVRRVTRLTKLLALPGQTSVLFIWNRVTRHS